MEKLTHLFEKKTFYKGIKNPRFFSKIFVTDQLYKPFTLQKDYWNN